ncbi:DUF262 domain-containing protein [bacterium 1xD42-87]|nr:DUF262 domain-containing protein [bacterium 1xD42-87]
MIKTTLNWTVKNLKSMYDGKHTLQMDHVIQRQSGQWDGDRLKKSLLIHSILANYPVPPVYCLKEAISEKDYSYSILDGKQRLTTTFDFIDGRYPLDTETPSVTIDDTVYELGGKYFTDLDVECQQELLRFKFTIYGFEDADDDLIEEIFFRLNNSTPLSKPQKAMPLCGVENAKFIKSILSDRFFSEICQFSALQRRKSDDMCTLLQAMMLLDNKYEGYEFSSISADEIMRYAASIKNNYSEEQKNRLYDIIDYLEKVFPEKDKMLKKINIPIVMLAADTAMGDGYDSLKNLYRVGPMYFRQWFSYFFSECYEEYKLYCSSGSIKKEKTLKRIEIMEASLVKYFELEETGEAEQDTALSKEDAPADESVLADEDSPVDESALTKEDASLGEAAPTDDSTPLTDAGLTESDPPADETESAAIGDNVGCASASEDTASYTASEQTEFSEKAEVEEPPEESIQDTE